MKKLMLRNTLTLFITVALCFALLPVTNGYAAGNIYRVKSTGLANGVCGDTWANACTLQNALTRATVGDQIWVAKGTHKPTSGSYRMATFNLKSGVAIYGGFAGSEDDLSQRNPVTNVTVLSGDIGVVGTKTDNSYHVVNGSYVDNTAVLDGFTISGGYANSTVRSEALGAGMNLYQSHPVLNQLIFKFNFATILGGGVAINRSNPTLTNITLVQNRTAGYGAGMALYLSDSTLNNVVFDRNISSQYAGGMYNEESNPVLDNVTFTGNTSVKDGGGMYNEVSDPVITNSVFIGNATGHTGGGLTNDYSNPVLSNVTFSKNTASDGGAFLCFRGETSLTDITFDQNTTTDNGGAVFLEECTGVFERVSFTNNSTENYGGAVHNYLSHVTMSDAVFTNNKSGSKGGGMFGYEGTLNLTNATFESNRSNLLGGGLANYYLTTAKITNVSFKDNYAATYGGAIYNDTSNVELVDANIISNESRYAGGMFIESGESSLRNVTFYQNYGVIGGAMTNYSRGLDLTNVTFVENESESWGAGFYSGVGDITLKNTTFSANATNGYGGAIALENTALEVNNSIFWGNTSARAGQQIYVGVKSSMNAVNSIFQVGCPEDGECVNIRTTNPKFGVLDNYGGFTLTLPLLSGSSAINNGGNYLCPDLDQRGEARPQGYKCDIGAYEAVVPGAFSKVSPQSAAVDLAADLTLSWKTSLNASKYAYCVDQVDDGKCNATWKAVGNSTSASLTGLVPGTYYWQVKAINGLGFTLANNGKWWSFTVAP
jgi:predicted outer membrane repeat protein